MGKNSETTMEIIKQYEDMKMKTNDKKLHKYQIGLITLLLLLAFSISINFFLSVHVKVKEVYKNDENIIFFGDSITSGYDIFEFFSNTHMVNHGISGETTEDLLDRLDKDIYEYNPSKVFLLIGVNDLNHEKSVKEVTDNIIEIAIKIKQNRPQAKLYVESIYPINRRLLDEHNYRFSDNVDNKKIKEINQKVEEFCKENNIPFINLYDELKNEDDELADKYAKEGLHLNYLGYAKVTKILNQYMQK